MRARPRNIPWLCVLGLCALGAGCAGPVARRPIATGAAGAGNRGGAWEVVLPGGQTAPELVMDWESARRDDALSFRDETSFSDADKPSLDNAEYLYIPHRADVLLYFPSDASFRGQGAYRWGQGAYGWGRGAYGWGRGAYRRR